MTSTLMKSPVKKRTDESTLPMEMVCPKINDNLKDTENSALRHLPHSKRWSTETWLKGLIEQENLDFKDFISISFHNPNKDVVDQYLDNDHIKNVILDFFYKNSKPDNRIRLWFFIERESMFFRQAKNQHLELVQGGDLHIHILMERVDLDWWLKGKNRNITLKKKTLYNVMTGNFTRLELMRETLINHIKDKVWRCPKSKQGVDIRDSGKIKKRIHYVNKSLSSVEFDKWEHIDFANSDLPICPVNKPKALIHSK